MTDFLKAAQDRYSVRKYKEDPVEPEKLEKILRAGQCAPTAANFQPQRIYVIESEEAKAVIRKYTRCLFEAPCALLVCYEKDEAWRCPLDKYCTGQDDAAIVTTQMMFEAHDLGLGSLWVRGFDGNGMREDLGLPSSEVICAMLTIGYAADDAEPAPAHFSNKPLDEMVKRL